MVVNVRLILIIISTTAALRIVAVPNKVFKGPTLYST